MRSSNPLNRLSRSPVSVASGLGMLILSVPLSLSLLIQGCDPSLRPQEEEKSHLDRILARGELIVLTRNASTTYYEAQDGPAGIEHDMAVSFAGHLGVKVRFELLESTAAILEALQNGRGDLAAAGLTQTEERAKAFLFGPSYQEVEQQVVCRRGGNVPKVVSDLPALALRVVNLSSYEERLKGLRVDVPDLKWVATREMGTEQLLERVWLREFDCTVADSNIVAINRRYFPELTVPFSLTQPERLAWALPAKSHALIARLNRWFTGFQEDGRLDALRERYYGFVALFDYVDIKAFERKIGTVFPRYRSLFEDAAQRHGLPLSLLAAQSYQESHWNPRAKSPTGVRGIMMLTQRTARSLGVRSRLDPKENIVAGARYLARLRDRVDPAVPEPDRTWIALAAYNVGMGHIHDAQSLARKMHKNPFAWNELKTVLPLLAQKKYYRTLKYGYARGGEPVRYVQRIRDFRDILERHLNQKG
ncbi:MAG: membrane-bound lytic murein transglycosylase MltF [Nitrospiria bacterium]